MVRTAGNRVDPRLPIDAEALLQWAIARTGDLPWDCVGDRDLMFDRGVTVKPRRRPQVGWILAEACAGVTYQGRPIVAHKTPCEDAATVIEAVKRLPPAQASMVLAHARRKTRPDWLPGAEISPASPVWTDPLRKIVMVMRYNGLRGAAKRNVPAYCPVEWSPSWPVICQARADYTLWHSGIEAVAQAVGEQLTGWCINGFAAPRSPWLFRSKETA